MKQAAKATLLLWVAIAILAIFVGASLHSQWGLIELVALLGMGGLQTLILLHDVRQRKQAEALIVRLKDIYAALSQTNQAVARNHDRDELLASVCRIAVTFGHFKMAWIGLVDPETKLVKPVASGGEAQEYLEALTVSADPDSPFGNGPTGIASRTGQVRVVDDLGHAPGTLPWRSRAVQYGFHSSAAFPLFFGGKPVGALNLYSPVLGFFTADRVDLLQEMANAVSWGLDRLALEEQSRRQDRELRQAMERLATFNSELQRFTTVAAHDLQEPIRNVVSFTQLLERRLGDRLTDTEREYCDMAVTEAKRMQRMILDLLTYSEAAEPSSPPRPVVLEEACRQAITDLQDSVAESGAEIGVEPLPQVMGDRARLVLLFRHLIANAVKFRHPGAAPHIRIAANAGDDEVVVSVADDGIGIDRGDQDPFELFRRLHAGPAYPGSGVGLAVCKRIVEAHGGRIWLEPPQGPGAVVCFALPAA